MANHPALREEDTAEVKDLKCLNLDWNVVVRGKDTSLACSRIHWGNATATLYTLYTAGEVNIRHKPSLWATETKGTQAWTTLIPVYGRESSGVRSRFRIPAK